MNISKLDFALNYLKAATDLLLPRRCIVCGRKLLLHEKHICMHCLADMPLTRFWNMSHNPMADRFNSVIQHGLEKVWDTEETGQEVLPRTGGTERYAYACALFYYDSDSLYRHIPHQIKYMGNIPAGKFFGRMLGRRMVEEDLWKDVDCVIPVPLHWKRKWKRGYNQAEVIAEEIALALDTEIHIGILRRKRNTGTQTKLDIKGKAENIRDAFEAAAAGKSFRHILLVDDIFTTGATLHACFQALRTRLGTGTRISIATLGFVGY